MAKEGDAEEALESILESVRLRCTDFRFIRSHLTMASLGAGYDLSSTTYSPDGRVFQVEYASKAVEGAGTVVGLKVKDGVILAVEKPIHSKLLKPYANRRIYTVDLPSGVVGTGLTADCRALANRARQECASHRETFENNMPGPMLAERLALFMQAYTLYGSVRPFCANLLVGSVDADGPHLYMIEPSGVCWGYRGCAAGKGRQTAKTEIEKLDLESLSMEQAVKEAARIIYLAHDEAKDKEFELEISWIGSNSNNCHELVPQVLLDDAIVSAKAALAARMDYD